MWPIMRTPNRASMSVIGLYNWDDRLFSQLQLPAGVNAQTVEENILMECGELTVLYPDWDFMYRAIKWWSEKELPTWERVYKLSLLEYNPIENYDRIEDELEQENVAEKRSRASESARNTSNTSGSTITENAQSATEDRAIGQNNTVKQVAGFNSNTLANQSGEAGNNVNTSNAKGSAITESSQEGTGSAEETGTENEFNQGDMLRNKNRASRIHGNIGVSTPADMMQKELEIYPKINIVDVIVRAFKERFCLMVY